MLARLLFFGENLTRDNWGRFVSVLGREWGRVGRIAQRIWGWGVFGVGASR